MAAPMYSGAPYGGQQVPAEAQSVKSMLGIVRILAIIFGVILLLVGLFVLAASAIFPLFGLFAIPFVIFGIIDIVLFYEAGQIRSMVDQGQYEAAKSKTLVWTILGFILGGIIVGILFLIAYLKFDPLINWQRSQGSAPAGWPGAAPTPMAAPPAAGVPPPGAPMCPKCGKPGTWIAQYSRWYCYTDSQYL